MNKDASSNLILLMNKIKAKTKYGITKMVRKRTIPEAEIKKSFIGNMSAIDKRMAG